MSVFVYKVTNQINGKFYIGVHDGSIDDNYWGSGKAIKAAIAKYGIDSFTKEIIKECSSKEEAYSLEKELVTPVLIESKMCYNLNVGGKGGWYHVDKRGDNNPMKNPITAKKVSDGIKASMTNEERAKRSERMKKMRADGTITKPKGWNHTEESKQKMRDALIGKPSKRKGVPQSKPDSEETRKNKSLGALRRMENGFDMGALTRGKTYAMKDKVCPHCGTEGKGGNMSRYHFDNCKKKGQDGHSAN